MSPNRNLRIRNIHARSPGRPLIPCLVPECNRWFKTPAGLTCHTRARHHNTSDTSAHPNAASPVSHPHSSDSEGFPVDDVEPLKVSARFSTYSESAGLIIVVSGQHN
jgi:hypothetical protein